MILAGVGYFLGYDGHYHFNKIGENYVENNVPFIGLRLWPAMCGVMVIPICFLILKEIKVSLPGCIFGALLLIFDNALVTQSRLILLDSMLMLFCVMSTYSWIRFYKERKTPYSSDWWTWLAMTGVSLGLTCGVKMVGLFIVASVGIAVLFELWDLLDSDRGLSMNQFAKHFAARALCLIALPIAMYLFSFYIHFIILNRTGPGDKFMSTIFQEGLIGNEVATQSSAIPYGANFTLKIRGSGSFLHSHLDKYPLRYKDDRVSSEGQQVTAYAHKDVNNLWQVMPATVEEVGSDYEQTDEERKRGVRYVKSGDRVRFLHVMTNTVLITHDVASPLTTTNMEITTYGVDEMKRYADTVWRIDCKDVDVGEKIKSKKNMVKVVNEKFKVALHSIKGVLPEWGFKQEEVNGAKKIKDDKGKLWVFDTITHPRIVNGTEIDEDGGDPKVTQSKKKALSFFSKFWELQLKMILHNSGLTKPHPYSSTAITWPFVLRGISFWENKKGFRQIYLLGNPFFWWCCVVAVALYPAMWIFDRILLQRKVDDYGLHARRWWDRAIGFLWITWFLHWIPFFLMGRMLFLHHYFPSYIYSTMILTTMVEFIGRILIQDMSLVSGNSRAPVSSWLTAQGGSRYLSFLVVVFFVGLLSFYYWSPFTYGSGFPDVATLRTRKWLDSWDMQYA